MTREIRPNDTVRIALKRDSPYCEGKVDHWAYEEYGVSPDAHYLVRFVDEDCVYVNQAPINGSRLMERRPVYGISALCREDYDFTVL